MDHYIRIHTNHQSIISLQNWASVCAVPTVDAVATDEVNCYNCIVRLRSLPRFAETHSQGYNCAAQRPPSVRGWLHVSQAVDAHLNELDLQAIFGVNVFSLNTSRLRNHQHICYVQTGAVSQRCDKLHFVLVEWSSCVCSSVNCIR